MKIKENNILIALFMGWEFNEETNMHYPPNGGISKRDDELLFHTSWEWLMPVVNKIGKDTTYPRHLIIDTISIFDSFGAIYSAVVEYIQWYNENN